MYTTLYMHTAKNTIVILLQGLQAVPACREIGSSLRLTYCSQLTLEAKHIEF